jgi:hypothetical protein
VLVNLDGGRTVVRNITIEPRIKVMISTDKPIYQPGQLVHVRSLAFENSAACCKNVTYEVLDVNGNVIFKKIRVPNEYGIAGFDYPLGEIIPHGTYTIRATVNGTAAERSILVKTYALPKFSIRMDGLKKWYLADECINGTASCKYTFGKDVQGIVSVEASVYYGVWTTYAYSNGTLSGGKFNFTLPPVHYAVGLPKNKNNGYVELYATVTDTGMHQENRQFFVSVAKKPILISAILDKNVPGETSRPCIIARYPDGEPVPDAVVGVLVGAYELGAVTDSCGIATVEFTYGGESCMDVSVTKEPYFVNETILLPVCDGMKIVPDKSSYAVGDTASFTVAYRGDSLTARGYYDVVANGFVVTQGTLSVDTKTSFSVTCTEDMAPKCEVRVYKIERDLDVVMDSVVVSVSPSESMEVNITSDKDVYKPKEEAKLEFQVKKGGVPVASALGISIVDTSVLELGGGMTGFDKVFSRLDDDFTVPSAQVYDYGNGSSKSTLALSSGDLKVVQLNSTLSYNWIPLMAISTLSALLLLAFAVSRRRLLAFLVAIILLTPNIFVVISLSLQSRVGEPVQSYYYMDSVDKPVRNLTGADQNDTVCLKSLTIAPAEIELTVNSTYKFSATALDTNDREMPNVTLKWTVINNIGSVDESGTFNASSSVGDGYVVVSAEKAMASCRVKLTPGNATRLEMSPMEKIIFVGESLQFTVKGYDVFGNPVKKLDLSWSASGDHGTIDTSGYFVSKRVGQCFVNVSTDDSVSTSTYVWIQYSSIKVSPKNLSIMVGESVQLYAAAYDVKNNPVPNVNFYWYTSYGKITETGLYTASTVATKDYVQAGVNIDGYRPNWDGMTITVRPAPLDKVEVLPSSLEICPDAIYPFEAKAMDMYGNLVNNVSVQWSTGDNLSEIDSTGLFHAKALAGNTTVKITVTQGLKTITKLVKIEITSNLPEPQRLEISPSTISPSNPYLPQEYPFFARIYDNSGREVCGPQINWTLDDSYIGDILYTTYNKVTLVVKDYGYTFLRATCGNVNTSAEINIILIIPVPIPAPPPPPSPPPQPILQTMTDSGHVQTDYDRDSVRKYFPETWYWNAALITDETGTAGLTLTAPDSITTWSVSATASTMDGDIGYADKKITVFQDFFIEPDIPASSVRNDTFPLKVMVFNYMDENITAQVRLEKDTWFELQSPDTQTVGVGSQSVQAVNFTIRPTAAGIHEVKVCSVTDNGHRDAVIKSIRVEPNGQMMRQTVNGELEDNDTANATMTILPDRVPNTEKASVKLQASICSMLVDGADNFINFVSGCGEQSASLLATDIAAYQNMQSRMNNSPERLAKYECIITQGVQHELTFLLPAKNGVGKGIVWFPSDQDVHPWLTSWGLITFQDAVNAGFTLDDAIFRDMQDWLVSQQNGNGSFEFPEWGLYETTNTLLLAKKVASTAYIERALLYSGYDPGSEPIKNASRFIEANVHGQWSDPYTLSLSLIALEMGGGAPMLRDDIAARLAALAKTDNDTVYWESDTNLADGGTGHSRYDDSSRTIETTGYALMALNRHGGYGCLVKNGVKYLLLHRSGMGGFRSTQDTVVAFQALNAVGDINRDGIDLTINVIQDGKVVQTVVYDDTTASRQDLIELKFSGNVTGISLESIGRGKVIYQIQSEFAMLWDAAMVEPKELFLNVTYSTTSISVDDSIRATVQLKYVGPEQVVRMILVDLRAPVGFSFVEDDLTKLVSDGTISHYELKDRQLLVYIDNVERCKLIEFSYGLKANMPVKGLIQGVNAYDMYDPAVKVLLDPVEVMAY